MCPGNHETASKQQTGRTHPGNKWLKAALVEAAQAIARTRGTYLAAQYRRLAARRGKQKAAVAVGHSLLLIVYRLLADGCEYVDLNPNYFDARGRQHVQRRLEDLSYRVNLESFAPPNIRRLTAAPPHFQSRAARMCPRCRLSWHGSCAP